MNITERRLWGGASAGAVLIVAWFAAMHTKLILAYRGGTLAQVHAMCGSSIGQFGRLLNTTAAAECNSIDNAATWWNLAGIAGLALVIGCGAWLAYRSQHKPGDRPVTPGSAPPSAGRPRLS